MFWISLLFKTENSSTHIWIFNSNCNGLFFFIFLLVCWDSASILRVSSINWRAADSYKLKVDILTFPPDVNSKKKKILDMKSSEIYTLI